MGDFDYTVKQSDKGLTHVFLEKAKAEGFSGKHVDWNKVMSVFDDIQKEEQTQSQSLFSGSESKTKEGWGKSYVIKNGEKIELDENQMKRIYDAMGFKKAKKASKEKMTEEQKQKVINEVESHLEKGMTAEQKEKVSQISGDNKQEIINEVESHLEQGMSAEQKQKIGQITGEKSVQKTDKTGTETENIKTPDMHGSYNITEGENGEGFKLQKHVITNGNLPAMKHFQTMYYDKGTKEYSIRNLKSNDTTVIKLAQKEAHELSVNNEIYKDLANKKAKGTELNKPELSFMDFHNKKLQNQGLKLDENNEIIEIPVEELKATVQPKEHKKNWVQRLFTGKN